jgi:uncharacterized protein YprB with RNaseH-like and TPR domain
MPTPNIPSNTDAILWLTNTMNTITTNLISNLETKLIYDMHTLCNERKIKHKHKNLNIQIPHLVHNINILMEDLQSHLTEEITKIKINSHTLTLNMSLLKTKPHLFSHTAWKPNTLLKQPKTIMQITSHDLIYNQLKDLQQDLIFLDTETDGLSTYKNNILSICMTTINMNTNPLDSSIPIEKLYYIKPGQNYTIDQNATASQINKITQMDLNNKGHHLKDIGTTIIKLLTEKIVVGFNINKFDIPMLRSNLKRHNLTLPPLQTIDLYQAHHNLVRHDLQSALKDLICYPIPSNLQHTANADTDACIRLLASFTKKLKLPTSKDLYIFKQDHTAKRSIFNTKI